MTDEDATETAMRPLQGRRPLGVNWTRLEGILGFGALIASFLWFLGMPTGMAIGVGFGIVLVSDVLRASIFGHSRSDDPGLGETEAVRH